jgi:hypothetical protein
MSRYNQHIKASAHCFFLIITILICTPWAISLAESTSEESPPFRRRVSIKVLGGLSSLAMKEWNRYSQMREETERFNRGNDTEIELQIAVTRRIWIAVGKNFIRGNTTVNYFEYPIYFAGESTPKDESIRWPLNEELRARVVPTYGTIYVNIGGNQIRPYLGVGIGHYASRLDYKKNWQEVPLATWDLEIGKFTDETWGFHGVAGIEYNITKNIALTTELKARRVKFSNYTGGLTKFFRDGREIVEPVTYIDRSLPSIPMIEVELSENVTPLSRCKPAVFDYSGFSLRFGLSLGL